MGKIQNSKKLEVRKEIENLLGLTSGSVARNSGVTYAEITQETRHHTSLPTGPTNQNHLSNELNGDIFKKLETAIENSNRYANAAKLTLDKAQKMLEKVDERMKTVARVECEYFFEKTTKVIDHKVNVLRNEFSNWYFELQNQITQQK